MSSARRTTMSATLGIGGSILAASLLVSPAALGNVGNWAAAGEVGASRSHERPPKTSFRR